MTIELKPLYSLAFVNMFYYQTIHLRGLFFTQHNRITPLENESIQWSKFKGCHKKYNFCAMDKNKVWPKVFNFFLISFYRISKIVMYEVKKSSGHCPSSSFNPLFCFLDIRSSDKCMHYQLIISLWFILYFFNRDLSILSGTNYWTRNHVFLDKNPSKYEQCPQS